MTADELLQQKTNLIGGIIEVQETGRVVSRGMMVGMVRDDSGKIIVAVDHLKRWIGGKWMDMNERIITFHESCLKDAGPFQDGILRLTVMYLGSIILYQKGVFRPMAVSGVPRTTR